MSENTEDTNTDTDTDTDNRVLIITRQLGDAQHQAILDLIKEVPAILKAHDDDHLNATVIAEAAGKLAQCPPFFSESSVSDIPDFAVQDYLDKLVKLEEFSAVEPYLDKIRFVWGCRAKKSDGQPVCGKARRASSKENALTGMWWEIELSLPSWALRNGMQRLRLLHHCLMRLAVKILKDDTVKPTTRPYAIREHAQTIQAFGMEGTLQVAVAAAAAKNPRTKEQLKTFNTNASGQGLLFSVFEG